MRAFLSHIGVHEFFVEGKDPDASQVIVHITEPANESEYRRGYIFMIAQADHAPMKTIETINAWVQEVETGFYEEPLHRDSAAAHFEHLLERVNRKSAALLRDLKSRDASLSLVIGMVNEQTLAFALRGVPVGFVAYKDKKTNAVNTIDITSENTEPHSDTQLFGSIINGALHAGDSVFFGTPEIAEQLELSEITSVLEQKTPIKGAAHFQNALDRIAGAASYGGVFLERVPEHASIETSEYESPSKKSSSKRDSISSLIDSQQATEETLAPSLFANMRKRLEARLQNSRATDEDAEEDDEPSASITAGTRHRERIAAMREGRSTSGGAYLHSIGSAIARGVRVAFPTIIRWSRALIVFVIMAVETLFFVTTNMGGRRREFIEYWKRNSSEQWERTSSWFGSLSWPHKIATVVVGLSAIAFVIGIGVVQWNRSSAADAQVYADTIVRIESLISSAESSLIYNEETRARVTMTEARTAIESLPNKSIDEENARVRLSSKLAGLEERIRRATHVSPTELVATAASGINPTSLLVTNNLLIVADPAKKLLVLERGSQKISTENDVPALNDFIGRATPEGLTFFISRGESIQWKNQADDAKVATTIPGSGMFDAAIYNDRLYSLVPSDKMIYRHGRYQEGFGTGTAWAKGNPDLSNAVSMAIDGNVWTLDKTGKIRMFERGEEKPITLSPVDPAVTNATQLVTFLNSKWLYTLEPTTKRLIVHEKTGAYTVQYILDNTSDIRAMAIDEAKKMAFVLDGASVKQFPLTHF
ncbi:MAG: hypothetical protein AAB384_02110 [Patescibacteria group bacterium]|mgnify:FL=1